MKIKFYHPCQHELKQGWRSEHTVIKKLGPDRMCKSGRLRTHKMCRCSLWTRMRSGVRVFFRLEELLNSVNSS